LNRLCFSTADDPFYKTSVSKYYPECIVYNEKGEVLARVNPKEKKQESMQMTYLDDFRDSALRINDDKKI